MHVFDIIKRLKTDYSEAEKAGYTVFGVFLYGSQNYGLATENSDVDTRVIVFPKYNDIINNTTISFTKELDKISHENHVCYYDFRSYMAKLMKCDLSYMETLFTDYFIINEDYRNVYNALREIREDIVKDNMNTIRNQIVGIIFNNRVTFYNGFDPNNIDEYMPKINKKQFKAAYNALRYNYMISCLLNGRCYAEAIRPCDNWLVKVKTGDLSRKEICDLIKYTMGNFLYKNIRDYKEMVFTENSGEYARIVEILRKNTFYDYLKNIRKD